MSTQEQRPASTTPGPINVSLAEEQTPARVRELRLKAGLTKLEAARCIGLSAAITWHGYETGRFAMPEWRWKDFLEALRGGDYAEHLMVPAPGCRRNGPRSRHSFTPGEHASGRPTAALIERAGSHLGRVRKALRVSHRDLAHHIDSVSASTLYAMEAGNKGAPRELMQAVSDFVVRRAKELERLALKVANIKHMERAIRDLQATQAEVGNYLYPGAKRPGAMISHLARGTLELSEERRTAINQALEDIRSKRLLAVSVAINEIERALA